MNLPSMNSPLLSAPLPDLELARIAVIGQGYVGLPLAAAFGHHFPTVGFDINQQRVAELNRQHDRTRELSTEELRAARLLKFSSDPATLAGCDVFIVAVPTPIDEYKRPDFGPLEAASRLVGRAIRPGGVVIYESTVYPGATEEVCVPIVAHESGLTFNRDFHAGYSPERINPGDRQHRLETIVKITSGSTAQAAALIDALYRRIIHAGTHPASSIRVAEAAKVIENTQRDLNIALVNDLAMLFNKLGIDTLEVLEAAGTKWNFLPFRPGLVGGHCIGVDPYYLTHKAQGIGHHPDVILAGRRTNDGMGAYVAAQVIRLMAGKGINPVDSRILVLGLAFKENCPDLRNTRVVDILAALKDYTARVDIHDPWVDAAAAKHEYGLDMTAVPAAGSYDAIVLAVGHQQFVALGADGIRAYGVPGSVVYDVKYVLPRDAVDGRL